MFTNVNLFPKLETSCSMENGRPPDPADWAVMDVVNYFRTAGFEEQASAFQEQAQNELPVTSSQHLLGCYSGDLSPDPHRLMRTFDLDLTTVERRLDIDYIQQMLTLKCLCVRHKHYCDFCSYFVTVILILL
nr:sterile alpha motif domain-containing protein 13 isoform X3 [Peromyscus maniculatus bairdii]